MATRCDEGCWPRNRRPNCWFAYTEENSMINRDLQKLVARDDGAGNSGYARGAMWRETPSAIGSRIRVASWLGLPGLTLPVFDGASRTFWSSHDVRIDTGGTSSTASVTGKSAPAGTIDNSPPIGSNQQERKHALQHSRRRDTKLGGLGVTYQSATSSCDRRLP